MSFSIDESKIDELLKSSKKGYEVAASSIGLDVGSYAPCYTASGVINVAPSLVTEETREHLMTLRRHIEESGVPLKSSDDLALETHKMRRDR